MQSFILSYGCPTAMAPSNDSSKACPVLKAEYVSPGATQTFSHPLPSTSAAGSTEEKTSYLSALRTSIVKLQEEVNEFLTAKMEEDKAIAASNGAKAKVDEKKEEENYGEEVVEDED